MKVGHNQWLMMGKKRGHFPDELQQIFGSNPGWGIWSDEELRRLTPSNDAPL